MLKEKAEAYFSTSFDGYTGICFHNKICEVQLGAIAEIKFENKNTMNYWVKTHRSGLLSRHLSKLSEPECFLEEFVYKLLHLLGIGQSLTAYYNSRDFYIGAKNA